MEIETSLINAYSCCANMPAAEDLFKEMTARGVDNSMVFPAVLPVQNIIYIPTISLCSHIETAEVYTILNWPF